MRCVVDRKEVVIEFTSGDHPDLQEDYRLILPRGLHRFYVDRLIPDEYRPWMQRWERYGRGLHDERRVTYSQIDADLPQRAVALPSSLLADLTQAIRYAFTGSIEHISEARGHA